MDRRVRRTQLLRRTLLGAADARAPGPNCEGMERVHRTYYLAAKAGGGIAAQTFHARLTAALAAGSTLDDALDGNADPGPQALRRGGFAASRNRGRILLLAAKALGIDHAIDTLGDQALTRLGHVPHRGRAGERGQATRSAAEASTTTRDRCGSTRPGASTRRPRQGSSRAPMRSKDLCSSPTTRGSPGHNQE